MGVFPNPLPDGFIFPEPNRRVDASHTLFPGDDAKAWFNHERLLTGAEVATVAADTGRFHIWGVTSYSDAFLIKRETTFSANVGGGDFVTSQQMFQAGNPNGPPWNWEYGPDHGYAT